jgi:hypothetical protein
MKGGMLHAVETPSFPRRTMAMRGEAACQTGTGALGKELLSPLG